MELSKEERKILLEAVRGLGPVNNLGINFCGCCGAGRSDTINTRYCVKEVAFVATNFDADTVDTSAVPYGRGYLVIPDKELNLLIDWVIG